MEDDPSLAAVVVMAAVVPRVLVSRTSPLLVLWLPRARKSMTECLVHDLGLAAADLTTVTMTAGVRSDVARASQTTSARAWQLWALEKKAKSGAKTAMIATTIDVVVVTRGTTSILTRAQTATIAAGHPGTRDGAGTREM
jgi:hypothetical protein